MGKKRKRPDSELTEAERERRDTQRSTQQAALDARQRGEVFESTRRTTFPKRKPLEARKEAARIAKRKSDSAAQRRTAQKAIKKERNAAPDVVVVPIFWKGEAKQMARVLSACADVEKALATSPWRVLLDTGHKYTPGQKFAHWEHKGVTLRVEVGPREAEKGWCTVARTFAAGEQAHRQERVVVGAETLQPVLKKLADMPIPDGIAATQHDEDEEEEEDDDEDPAIRRGRGGDDLDDDFVERKAADEDEDEDEDEPQVLNLKSKAAEAKPQRKKVVKF